jgi:hypothetical protein
VRSASEYYQFTLEVFPSSVADQQVKKNSSCGGRKLDLHLGKSKNNRS